jgi:hypothetical protein
VPPKLDLVKLECGRPAGPPLVHRGWLVCRARKGQSGRRDRLARPGPMVPPSLLNICPLQTVTSLAALSFSKPVGFGNTIQTIGTSFTSFVLTTPGTYEFEFRSGIGILGGPGNMFANQIGVVLQVNGAPSGLSLNSTWGAFLLTPSGGSNGVLFNQVHGSNLLITINSNTAVSLINNSENPLVFGETPPPYSGGDITPYQWGDCVLVITQLH